MDLILDVRRRTFTGHQVCEGIRQTLQETGKRYHVSSSTSLEDCLMALDLDAPTMDRGLCRVDNIPLWEWRDRLLLDCPPACLAVDTVEFTVALSCLLLQWMCGLCLPQDSLLCCLPLCRLELAGKLAPVVKGFWFVINQVCEQISMAGFHKDERAVGRNFYGTKWAQEEPVASGVSWLDCLQAFFWAKKWKTGDLLPVLPSIDLDVQSLKGLFEPSLSNTFGVGCTRNPRLDLSIDHANALINTFNSQIRSFHHLHSITLSVTPSHISPIPCRSLGDVANAIDLSLSPSHQIIRAIAINELFSSGLLASTSLLWAACGGPMSVQEYRAACDAIHCLLHSAPRLRRLIPDWLEGARCINEPSSSFHPLVIFMKMKFVQLGFELHLYSRYEDELKEAEEWIQRLSSTHHGFEDGKTVSRETSKRFKHRWQCLL